MGNLGPCIVNFCIFLTYLGYLSPAYFLKNCHIKLTAQPNKRTSFASCKNSVSTNSLSSHTQLKHLTIQNISNLSGKPTHPLALCLISDTSSLPPSATSALLQGHTLVTVSSSVSTVSRTKCFQSISSYDH